jgi:hypothetical protein
MSPSFERDYESSCRFIVGVSEWGWRFAPQPVGTGITRGPGAKPPPMNCPMPDVRHRRLRVIITRCQSSFRIRTVKSVRDALEMAEQTEVWHAERTAARRWDRRNRWLRKMVRSSHLQARAPPRSAGRKSRRPAHRGNGASCPLASRPDLPLHLTFHESE